MKYQVHDNLTAIERREQLKRNGMMLEPKFRYDNRGELLIHG